MAPPYTRHVFVCTNRRPEGAPKGCCASKGSEDLRSALKRAVDVRGLSGIRINAAGCLDACEVGVAMVVYPENVWYQGVTVGDVDAIVDYLAGGPPVERLLMKFPIPKKKVG